MCMHLYSFSHLKVVKNENCHLLTHVVPNLRILLKILESIFYLIPGVSMEPLYWDTRPSEIPLCLSKMLLINHSVNGDYSILTG